MDAEHKEILRRNQVNLVDQMSMDSNLVDFLKEQRVLTASMEEEIKAQQPLRNQARKLLEVLPKRGPNAFGHFLCCLKLSGHEHLATSLYNSCRPPPTLLIDQYDDQHRRSLLELCGMQVSGLQSSGTFPAESQLATGSGSSIQVSGALADYVNDSAHTLILNMGCAQAESLQDVFSQKLLHKVEYKDENSLDINASNKIKVFMEDVKESLVSVVILVRGDASNDQTVVSSGATISSLKAAFYHSAKSPALVTRPKFLMLIGFVPANQVSADGTDATAAVHGQVTELDARVPSGSGSTHRTQDSSNTKITPSGADCFGLIVNLPADDAIALKNLCNILATDDTVSEIARKMRNQFAGFEEASSRRNLKLKCSLPASGVVDDRQPPHLDTRDAITAVSANPLAQASD